MSNAGIFSRLRHGANSKFNVDRKSIEKCYRWMDKVMKSCQQSRMNLRNSPPYILDTIPDTFAYIHGIIQKYKENYTELNEIEYFRLFIESMIQKCRETMDLFKSGKDLMFEDGSAYRHKLTTHSLVYSHLLKDLEALFPDFTFVSGNFQVTKSAAATWWSLHFSNRVVVPWKQFQSVLGQMHSQGRIEGMEACALKKTIDLTRNDHVSIFEFDVFVRLFQPWENIIQNWNVLAVTHPAYMDFQTYDDVKARLQRCPPGSYVYRQSCTKLGQWAIGYVTENNHILQTIIQNKSLAQALMDGEREGYYLFPNGQPCASHSTHGVGQLLQGLSEVRIPVTPEQYQVYCEMGSTFQLCKICAENDKDVRLEPCGHLLCSACLLSWSASVDGQSCPFCRREIKGTEQIVVDPFQPAHLNTDTAPLPNGAGGGSAAAAAAAAVASKNTASTTTPSAADSSGQQHDLICLHGEVKRAPPLPPRFASPAASPSTKRRLPKNAASVATAAATPTLPLLCTSTASLRSRSVKDVNYVQLEFEDSDSAAEDLPLPSPPPPTLMPSNAVLTFVHPSDQQALSSASTRSSVSSAESPPAAAAAANSALSCNSVGVQLPNSIIERFVMQLVNEGQPEAASRRLLEITDNNLRMTREILREFQLIDKP